MGSGEMSRNQATTIIILLLLAIALGLYLIIALRPVPVKTVVAENYLSGRSIGWVDTGIDIDTPTHISVTGYLDLLSVLKGIPAAEAHYRYLATVPPQGVFIPEPPPHLQRYYNYASWEYTYLKMYKHLPYMSVVGKLGVNGREFFIGPEYNINGTGRLYLAINYFSYWRQPGISGSPSRLTQDRILTASGGFTFKLSPQDETLRAVFVSSNDTWQSVTLPKGAYTVYGAASSKALRDTDFGQEHLSLFHFADANGWTKPVPDLVTLSKRLAPQCPFMSLVGRTANGNLRCLGETFTLDSTGEISLAVNDIYWDRHDNAMPNWLSENEGGFIVRTKR